MCVVDTYYIYSYKKKGQEKEREECASVRSGSHSLLPENEGQSLSKATNTVLRIRAVPRVMKVRFSLGEVRVRVESSRLCRFCPVKTLAVVGGLCSVE